jgi:hypothetical protein
MNQLLRSPSLDDLDQLCPFWWILLPVLTAFAVCGFLHHTGASHKMCAASLWLAVHMAMYIQFGHTYHLACGLVAACVHMTCTCQTQESYNDAAMLWVQAFIFFISMSVGIIECGCLLLIWAVPCILGNSLVNVYGELPYVSTVVNKIVGGLCNMTGVETDTFYFDTATGFILPTTLMHFVGTWECISTSRPELEAAATHEDKALPAPAAALRSDIAPVNQESRLPAPAAAAPPPPPDVPPPKQQSPPSEQNDKQDSRVLTKSTLKGATKADLIGYCEMNDWSYESKWTVVQFKQFIMEKSSAAPAAAPAPTPAAAPAPNPAPASAQKSLNAGRVKATPNVDAVEAAFAEDSKKRGNGHITNNGESAAKRRRVVDNGSASTDKNSTGGGRRNAPAQTNVTMP